MARVEGSIQPSAWAARVDGCNGRLDLLIRPPTLLSRLTLLVLRRAEQDFPFLVAHRTAARLRIQHLEPALDGGPGVDRLEPALHIGKLFLVDAAPVAIAHPGE